MDKPCSILSLSLCFLVLFQCSFARQLAQQQQNQCQLQRLSALEPTSRSQGEAGYTEMWDQNSDEFQCAGVAVIRHTIQPRGLLLPSYTSAPLLVYIVQGRGMNGVVLPGCAETFQSSQESQQQTREKRFQDQHQQIRHFREGDILAFPAGVAHWIYNDGERDLIAVVMSDNSNSANQLDLNARRFFLAGNPPQIQQQQQGQGQGQGPEQQQRERNVFSGFKVEILAEAFGVNTETAKKLQNENDERGHIVRVEGGLQVIRPPMEQEQQPQQPGQGQGNGLEETICSMRMSENINDPSRADIFNPRAGRLTSLNSLNLPILKFLKLSAQRVVLHRNAILAPHWNGNAHSVMYVTKGEAQVQVVDNRGQAVFDGVVREGQVLVVPQNYAVVERAGEQGSEWVVFKTNDKATINTLAGKTSAMRGLPVDVIVNAYRMSQEEAINLKFSRDSTALFAPRPRPQMMRAYA